MNRKKALCAGVAALALAACPALSATRTGGPPSPTEDGTLKALAAIAGAGAMENDAYAYLEELSDDIGGRVTGSPEAEKAIAWGAEKMRSIGLENVHTESWQLFRGWTRGSADAEITSPIHRRLMIDAMGWVGSTPAGGVDASVVPVNAFDIENEVKNNAGTWRGKVLLVVHKGKPPADFMAAFAKFGDFLKAAHDAGAVAVIAGQGGGASAGMHLTHTGVLGFDAVLEIPVVSMAAEDQEQLERFSSTASLCGSTSTFRTSSRMGRSKARMSWAKFGARQIRNRSSWWAGTWILGISLPEPRTTAAGPPPRLARPKQS